jgi:hypothetical protein
MFLLTDLSIGVLLLPNGVVQYIGAAVTARVVLFVYVVITLDTVPVVIAVIKNSPIKSVGYCPKNIIEPTLIVEGIGIDVMIWLVFSGMVPLIKFSYWKADAFVDEPRDEPRADPNAEFVISAMEVAEEFVALQPASKNDIFNEQSCACTSCKLVD